MSRTNRSSRARLAAASLAGLGCVAVLISATSTIATQSRIIPPQRPANSNTAKRPKVATLRANDSNDGSRATLTADQSLSEYEAYRRGDRFYVKIPAADVPRPEAVRGRAFGDVKVQRASDSTVVSFRLQPGATARVEQRGNKLDVVFTMPGSRPSTSSSTRDVARNDAGPAPPQDSKRRSASNSNTSPTTTSSNRSANRNSADRGAAARPTPTPKPSPSPKAGASPSPSPKASASPVVKSSPLVAQQKSSPSPTSATSGSQTDSGNTWANFKQRVRYWILLAQLNPIPVAIGAAVLLFFIGLLIFQRRRARATRRVRARKAPRKVEPIVAAPVTAAPTEATVANARTIEPAEASTAIADTAIAGAAVASPALAPEETEAPPTDERSQRVSRVSDEVKRLMAGGDYNESVVASDDPETRRLVGAELLSALVGRNMQRRERARAAFMKHGYFDDATRDLRIAESSNERAAAARRLSFVHEREATPHLIAALDDSSPDVRRAAVEALMDLRDPAAIAPLNSLMQTENDRKVPRSLIKHAVEACSTSSSDESATMPASSSLPHHAAAPVAPPAEIDREVIEI